MRHCIARIAPAVAIAAILLVAPATAQPTTANCSGFASAPSLPNGATASHGAMASAGRAVEAWRLERESKLATCRADIEALRAQLNAMEQAYNQAGNERNGVLAAWNGEVVEFTDRRRRRD